jgi:hypothetical protein
MARRQQFGGVNSLAALAPDRLARHSDYLRYRPPS